MPDIIHPSYAGDAKHKHVLPAPGPFLPGTLVRCAECQQWFSRQAIRSGDTGVDIVWERVRWWNLFDRRRIRKAE